jgi:hypothetical protein
MPLAVAMALIAGAALGFWLVLPEIRAVGDPDDLTLEPGLGKWFLALVFTLGGVSLLGPPLLLAFARRRPWSAGRLLWFAHGTATWLLWPPVTYNRIFHDGRLKDSMSAICYFYGTPLMAVYMTAALLAGGYLGRKSRRRMQRSWQETLGLLVGLVWACTGLYLISLFYRRDLLGR